MQERKNAVSLHSLKTSKRQARALSSVGLEHLPYKQRVGGSTPSAPTKESRRTQCGGIFHSLPTLPPPHAGANATGAKPKGSHGQVIFTFYVKKSAKNLEDSQKNHTFALRQARALSSVGLEHLPYKQRVGGSTPSAPTKESRRTQCGGIFLFRQISIKSSSAKFRLLLKDKQKRFCRLTIRAKALSLTAVRPRRRPRRK